MNDLTEGSFCLWNFWLLYCLVIGRTQTKIQKVPGGTMKQLILICAAMAALTACNEQDANTSTPKGIILVGVKALSEHRTNDFNSLLSGVALSKYGSPMIQDELLKSLGDLRQITLGQEQVHSNQSHGNSIVTISSVDVYKAGNPVYTVVTQCVQTTTSSTHTVCTPHQTPHDNYYPPSHGGGHHNGGGYNNGGGYTGGSNDGGGYITPGITHEVDPSTPPSDDGHKPGNQDPDRPVRFDSIYNFQNGRGEDCYDTTDSNTYVSCKIIDLQ